MSNICGGDQHHPAYNLRTKLNDNQVLIGNDFYTIEFNGFVESVTKENVNGHISFIREEDYPREVKDKVLKCISLVR